MNYQAICAAIEVPLNTAFGGLNPPVKIFFDNLIARPPDPPGEYVMVNITFGLTTESAIAKSYDFARGAVIVRVFTRKGNGGLRARQLSEVASCALKTLGESKKPATGVFLRIRNLKGPEFFMDEDQPHFLARITAGWDATNLG